MRRALVFVLIAILFLSSCAGEDIPSDAIGDDSLTLILEENDALLEKYVTMSGNALISLAGLNEEMNALCIASEKALSLTRECVPLVQNFIDKEELTQDIEKISQINLSLIEKNDKMKQARKDRDLQVLENSLNELTGIVGDYCELLDYLKDRLSC